MVGYSPSVGSSVVNRRQKLTTRVDIDPATISILEPELPNEEELTQDDGNVLEESLNYSPAIGNFSSPISKRDRDITDLNKDNPSDDSLLKTEEEESNKKVLELSDKEMVQYVPSDVVDYYNEAALTAKEKNALPDDMFGLPRLRAYPLNDAKHVKQAIRMFHHCKDPKDKSILAKNIFRRVEELNIDATIGKNNPLHDYAPKSLQETSFIQLTENDQVDTTVVSTKPKTKEEILKDHLQLNGNFYNHVFFGNEFSQSVKAIKEFSFFNYFYPNFRTHSLYARLKSALGGMGYSKEVYNQLKIRYPFETDFTKPLGFISSNEVEDINLLSTLSYDVNTNWFHCDLSNDVNHTFYCLRLYSILGDMMNNPNFNMDDLTDNHYGILTDWIQMVQYHYDLMKESEPYSNEYFKQAQYLYDLFWNCNDNPMDDSIITANIVAMGTNMAVAKTLVGNINEATELLTKEECTAYLVKELGFDDDMFLLPSTLEYPVINQTSVRMAMDCIRKIPADQIKEYTTNLNRKYVELGCTFSISIDHPYAPYADKAIVDNMNRILMEGDTAVGDEGTSIGKTDITTDPWYKRVVTDDGNTSNLLDDKELGPTGKSKHTQDFTRTTSYA